jgi:hypothetical protein
MNEGNASEPTWRGISSIPIYPKIEGICRPMGTCTRERGRLPGDALMGHALVMFFVITLSAFTAVAQPLEGRLKIVRDTATLRLAYRTDSRPFSFLDGQGQPRGFTIELQ